VLRGEDGDLLERRSKNGPRRLFSGVNPKLRGELSANARSEERNGRKSHPLLKIFGGKIPGPGLPAPGEQVMRACRQPGSRICGRSLKGGPAGPTQTIEARKGCIYAVLVGNHRRGTNGSLPEKNRLNYGVDGREGYGVTWFCREWKAD